ncbi:hypothetical protein [Rheinheimera soli]|uniref:Uncharacterized protein n=1 Tax=Rheinheimera soli TaxID=443616 RepID=A0ABU1W5C1_9GAMM|nr:hypothetical protein [Rheinheimera soli]MDR7123163.1 hypothetical protein [Rheinheimera soli]
MSTHCAEKPWLVLDDWTEEPLAILVKAKFQEAYQYHNQQHKYRLIAMAFKKLYHRAISPNNQSSASVVWACHWCFCV